LAARRLIAIVVEGKAEDDGHRFQFRAASHDLRDRRTLAHSPRNESGGRRYGTGWIRNREADAAIAVVDGQNAAEKREADRFAVLREEGRGRVAATLVYLTALLRRLFPIPFSPLPHPCAIVAKNSLFVLVRCMRCSRNSMASVDGMSPRKLRSRYTRFSSSCVNNNSSLR